MATLPPSNIQIFSTISGYREWRNEARENRRSVGYVPTMGALHDGHLSLVNRSLSANDLTVVSIFVNPAQFAPHEDLTTYPRTMPQDLEMLSGVSVVVEEGGARVTRTPSAVFAPTVAEMYPSGIVQDVRDQKGTFVEVKGFGHQMEGQGRPTFFRGVATVVTKLFNVIEPAAAYFGQKDIQQALILRRMCSDLLLSHPEPHNLHIVATVRDPTDGLALSSRNAYLTPGERQVANTLYLALKVAQRCWESDGLTKRESVGRAKDVVERVRLRAAEGGVEMRLEYLEVNRADSFEVVEESDVWKPGRGSMIMSGALWVGKTRLIDNVILGDSASLGILP